MIARIFPRRTGATPDDSLAFVGCAPQLFPPEVDEVHISVTFTYDMGLAEDLAKDWKRIAPVKMGGPAFNEPEGDFIPGQYVKKGYVITSRGCPNRCWFCSVWKRNGGIRELPITEGWNLQDDNILACSDSHIKAVFSMLKKQKKRAQLTGGLEAARLEDWHVDLLQDLKPAQMFFAYDTPDDYEPLVVASKMLIDAGFNRNSMRCYVLIGHPKDTMEDAEKRLWETVDLGFFPMAMLWKNDKGETNRDWARLQRAWARPATIAAMVKARGV